MFKKIFNFILGFSLLTLGITLILAWWPSVIVLFKGSVGAILALGGLFILSMVKDNNA